MSKTMPAWRPLEITSRALLFVTLLVVMSMGGGCQSRQIPDPNDPKNIAPADLAKKLREKIQATADDLNLRVANNQISDATRLQLLAQESDRLLAYGDYHHAAPQDAWVYADLLLTARRFSDAIPVLEVAIKWATDVKNDDRRVNDSLRLARALAMTGKTKAALDLVQSVIASKPKDPGPVLPATLLEITPITQGKGYDIELAKLLELAIGEHMRMIVDPNTDAGKMFLFARPHHIFGAWRKIIELYTKSGRKDEATAATKRGKEMMTKLGLPSAGDRLANTSV